MSAPPPPPPPLRSGGLSLYDHLQDPNDKSSSTTISSAPVLYSQGQSQTTEAAPKKPLDPSLRFQPIRRPPAKSSKPAKPKPSFPPATAATTASSAASPSNVATAAAPQQKTSLADWAATQEDEWRYSVEEKRQRGGRKKKKKRHQVQVETDWDDIYDPARPTNVDEYLKSDERIDEVREWKALLYRHRRRKDDSDMSEDDDSRPAPSNQFAPPSSYNFAPPPPQSPPPAPIPPPNTLPHPPPPPPVDTQDTTTISAAPIRYTKAASDSDGYSPPPPEPMADDPPPKTSLPGQAGFAQRFMTKYGWKAGTGLGADSSGIVNPLRVQVEKRRRRADADGGGWADPANKAKIIGGKRAPGTDNGGGKFGPMSEVIVLRNMLDNMPDLQEEISAGLGQEIGEECGEKYGRVERLYIDQDRRLVFIKFTDQVSSLRAVNELDGRVFNGNTIVPRFYDSDQFERGIYDK